MRDRYPEIEPHEHGLLDLGNPLGIPWELARARPGRELVLVHSPGHGRGAGLAAAIVDATDQSRPALFPNRPPA